MNSPWPLAGEYRSAALANALRETNCATDPVLEGLVRTAARIAVTPIALVSLLDGAHPCVKARVGIDAAQADRIVSFSDLVIAQNKVVVVEDASCDLRFARAPMVAGEAGVRFLAGIPLKVDAHAVGALCVMDTRARPFDNDAQAILRDVARAVEHWIESCHERDTLRQREREFHQLMEQLPAIVYRAGIEPPHVPFYVSPNVGKLCGTVDRALDDPGALAGLTHPEDRERVALEGAVSLAFGDRMRRDYRISDGEGHWRHVHDVAHVVRPDDGSAPYLQGVMLDISERVAAESAACEAVAYWRGLFAQLPDGVLVVDGEQQIVDANPQAAAMLGYTLEELKHMRLPELIEGDSTEALAEEARVVFAGDIFVAERAYRRRDGGRLIIEVRASAPVKDRYVKVMRDVTQRREQDAQLNKLLQAVEQSSESIFIADLSGAIEYVNAAGAAVSGYDREEMIGRNSRMLKSGKTPPGTHEAIWQHLGAGKTWKGLLYNRRKNGEDYIERATITPIQGRQGEITHYLAVKEDVTEKQRMAEEIERHRHHLEELVQQRTQDLQRATRAAESANEAKSTFLAAMSHEIRTPMNGVVGVVEVLSQSSLTPYQSDLVDTIRESASALLRIIDDILDFSKIEAGRLTLDMEVVDFQHVVEQVCVGLAPVARSHGVALQVFVDPALPRHVVSDGVRLRQILNNLVGNAIKFSSGLSHAGRVRVCVIPHGEGSALLRVIDNGIGIAPEAQERIFAPFVQAESSTTRRYGGTGLGLPICRRLVEMFRGGITVESRPGSGATFEVTLPVAPALPKTSPRPDPGLTGFVVEVRVRDALLRADWCEYLSAAGAQTAGSLHRQAPVAMEPGASRPIRIVVTDSMSEVGNRPQEQPGTADTDGWVIIEEGQRRQPRLASPSQVLLDSPMLQRESLVLAVAMAGGRALPAIEQLAQSLPLGDVATLSIEEAATQGRLVLVAEDNEINQKVIRHQLALLGLVCEIVHDGNEALRQIRSGRYALLLTDLHMPGLDGYELSRTIRREVPGGAVLPIIAISATTLQGEAERCRNAGMDDYLSKPVHLEHLARVLGRWLPQLAKPASRGDKHPAEPPQVRPFFDARVLPGLVGDDPEMLREFGRDFMRSLRRGVDELSEALRAGDIKRVGDIAHRLKSSSRAIGMLGIGDCCARIEAAGHANEMPTAARTIAELEENLPKAAAALAATARIDAEPSAEELVAQPVVMVIDDDPLQSRLLCRQLGMQGIDAVQQCNSGVEALKKLEGSDCAAMLLLIDLNMPGMDGVELIRHLAERQFSGTLGLVSGADERVLETATKLASAYQLRVVAHLHKPVQATALKPVIEAWRNADRRSTWLRTPKVRGVAEVRHAIESDQLVVYYQPMVQVDSGKFIGVEALVRWQHPEEGLLGAGEIVGVAEAHGMADALTQRVLHLALAQLRQWKDDGLALRIAVNISMQNLARLSFPEYVMDQLNQHGIAPGDLLLEITESQLLRDVRLPMDILTRLRLKNIGLSIDDFGTGHSSLSQLRDLPFDELKIDRGFVHGSREQPTQRAIFHASLKMAHELNMVAVAEGLEDRGDWDFVKTAGCDIAQGYFIGKPMPAHQLMDWHDRWLLRNGEL